MFDCMGIVIFLIFSALPISIHCEDSESYFNPHIVGGKNSDIRDHSYLVSIRYRGHHFCGGSIYSPKIVITAAHCMVIKPAPELKVFGESTFLLHQKMLKSVAKALIHPNYINASFDYDVTVVILDGPLIFNEFIQPIRLATSHAADDATAIIAGWGYTKESSFNNNQLQEATVTIINNERCKQLYQHFFTSRMICAGSMDTDACQNDSGGPLVYDNQLLGIIAFGHRCGIKGYPGVYISIPDMYEWISNVSSMEN